MMRLLWVSLLAFFSVAAQAATYSLPSGALPFGCFRSGSTVTCNSITLNNDDRVNITSGTSWVINGNFTSRDRVFINSGGNPANLTMRVSGNANFGRDNTLAANLVVGGTATLNDRFIHNGSLSAGTLQSYYDVRINGNVSVTNNFTAFDRIHVDGNINARNLTLGYDAQVVGNNITVTDRVYMNERAVIDANIDANDIDIGRDSQINGSLVGHNVLIRERAKIDGNVNATGRVDNYGTITGYVNSPVINDGSRGIQGQTCDYNENIGPCVFGANAIGYWRMNQLAWSGANNEVIDSSSNAFNGRAIGGANTAIATPARVGNPGTCRYGVFNGRNRFEVANNSVINNASSVSVGIWVKAQGNQQSNETYQSLVIYGSGPTQGSNGRFEFYRRTADGRLYFEIRTRFGSVRAVSVSGSSVFDDQWHHLVGVFDSANNRLRLYVDGNLVSTNSYYSDNSLNSVSGPLAVGSQAFGSNGINGYLDELYIAGRAMSDSEVQTLYQQVSDCVPEPEPTPQACIAIWPSRVESSFSFPKSLKELMPATGLSPNPLPNALQATDYRYSGTQTIGSGSKQTAGASSRLFFDGDLTINDNITLNSNGPSSNLLLVVTGNLTINNGVTINGFVAVGGNITINNGFLSAANATINGALSMGGQANAACSGLFCGSANLSVNDRLSQLVNLDGGSFCYNDTNQCFTDNFNDTSRFNNEWQVNSSSGSFTPQLVQGRLRLTQDSPRQATLAMLKQIFPAANNLIQIEFDYYGWSPNRGSGADGIALVLSDANVVPVPGSYGGSLGYAQRNNGDNGFAGGWLGIGFDEFGNFSNSTEGRIGPQFGPEPGFRADAVAIRGAGAGQTGYRYLRGTSSLRPELDTRNTSSPAPGHRYRVTVDSRLTNQTIVSVQRDTGNGFETIIAPFDVFDYNGQQPTVPDNFLISFTGSTGDNSNIHDIDNIRVCAAESFPYDGTVVDHYRLRFNSHELTCTPATITVDACTSPSCDQTHNGAASVTLTPSAANWAANPLVFNNGSGSVDLAQTSAGTLTLGVNTAESSPAAITTTQCYADGSSSPTSCDITFADAGFVFAPIATQVAGVPFQTQIQAVRRDTLTGACQAFLTGDNSLDLSMRCDNPNSCSDLNAYPWAELTAKGVGQGSYQRVPPLNDYQNIAVSFDNQSRTTLDVNYGDAGAISLHARKQLPNGVMLEGSSDSFVVRPAAARLTVSTNYDYSNGIIARAGEDFTGELRALNAQGEITPNFGNESQPHKLTLADTADAVENFDGDLVGVEFERTNVDDLFTADSLEYSEVGHARFTIEFANSHNDNDYLGSGPLNHVSDVVGRFVPYHFKQTAASVIPACAVGEFSYMGQAFSAAVDTVRAENRYGQVTRNYHDDLAKAKALLVAQADSVDLSNRVIPTEAQSISWSEGVGQFSVQATLTRAATPDGPYDDFQLGWYVEDNDGEYSHLLASEVSAPAVCNGARCAAIGSTFKQRYGRLVFPDVNGSDIENISVEAYVEYWNGERFVFNQEDSCSTLSASGFSAVNDPDNLFQTPQGSSPVTLQNGKLPFNVLQWLHDGRPGEFEFEYAAPDHLRFGWFSDEADYGDNNQPPRANVIFGQYRGNERLIYWREVGW